MGRLITGAMFGGVERCGHWTKAVAARPDNCTTIRQVRFDAEAINRHQEALSHVRFIIGLDELARPSLHLHGCSMHRVGSIRSGCSPGALDLLR